MIGGWDEPFRYEPFAAEVASNGLGTQRPSPAELPHNVQERLWMRRRGGLRRTKKEHIRFSNDRDAD
jgi:hypothetical protein